jgi:hypothetical protein
MKVLKGLALGLVSFLLFIALPFLMLALTINSTALNPQFMIAEAKKLDIASVAKEILADQLPSDYRDYLPAMDNTIDEVKPWINQQTNYVINAAYDYLLGKTESFSLTIATDPIKPSLVNNMTKAYLQSPPPEYRQLSAVEQQRYVAEFRQEYMDSIPPTVEVNQNIIGAGGMDALRQAREIIGYIRTAYFGLIGFCVLLILLIILILRQVKGATRSIGIIFLITGAYTVASFFVGRLVIPGAIPMNDLPSHISVWLPGFINDLLTPYEIISLSLLIVGIILFVFSFFYRSRKEELVNTPTPAI